MGRLLKVFFVIVGYLILFDIGGVALAFVFGILPLESISTPLYFVAWFVAGVFCGLFAYNKAGSILLPVTEGDWAGAPGSGKVGLISLAMTTVILAIWLAVFYKFAWPHGGSSDPYVPDNVPMTYTYFGAVLGSMILGHTVIRPSTVAKPKPEAQSNGE